MSTRDNLPRETQKNTTPEPTSPKVSSDTSSKQLFNDERPEAVMQSKFQKMANDSPQAQQLFQLQSLASSFSTNNLLKKTQAKSGVIQREFIGELAKKDSMDVFLDLWHLPEFKEWLAVSHLYSLEDDTVNKYENLEQVKAKLLESRPKIEESEKEKDESKEVSSEEMSSSHLKKSGGSKFTPLKSPLLPRKSLFKSVPRKLGASMDEEFDESPSKENLAAGDAAISEARKMSHKGPGNQKTSDPESIFRLNKARILENLIYVTDIKLVVGCQPAFRQLVWHSFILEKTGGATCDHMSAATYLQLLNSGKKPVWVRYTPSSDRDHSIKGPNTLAFEEKERKRKAGDEEIIQEDLFRKLTRKPKEQKQDDFHSSVLLPDTEKGGHTEVDAWFPDMGRIRKINSEEDTPNLEIKLKWEPELLKFAVKIRQELEEKFSNLKEDWDAKATDSIETSLWEILKK